MIPSKLVDAIIGCRRHTQVTELMKQNLPVEQQAWLCKQLSVF